MAVPLQSPYAQFFDSNGDPLSGGKVYTYFAGTTTPKATYTDADEGTQAANPVILDSAGRAAIWITGTYRFDVYTSADVLVRSTDDVPAFTAGGDMTKAVYDPANIAQQMVGTTAVQTLTNKTITTTASSTGAAGLNVPHGTAPTSPVNGDTWTETGGLSVRINGETTPLGVRSAGVSATTSGTSIDITGIPASAKDIVVALQSVSTNGTSNFLLQIGNGSVETSGYTSSSEYAGTAAQSTAGFILRNNAAAESHNGNFHIYWINGFNYIGSGILRGSTGTGSGGAASGQKVTSARIDRVRLTTVGGTDTFDNGAIAVSYRC